MKKVLKPVKKQFKRAKNLSRFFIRPFKDYRKSIQAHRGLLYGYHFEKTSIDEKMVLLETAHGEKIGGNPYAIYEKMIVDPKFNGFKYIWVLNNLDDWFYSEKIKEKQNVVVVKRDSDEYIKYLAKAKYLINDTTFPFYFQKKEGQVYVNTWHGTPIKTLGKDVKGTLGQHKNAIRNFLHADYLVHPNRFTADIVNEAHELNGIYQGKIVDSGYPRVDLTLNADKKLVKSFLEKVLEKKIDKKIVLYAPTWRGELGKIKNIDEDLIKHVKEIQSGLPEDYILLLKVHNLTYRFIKDNDIFENICIPNWFETNELLSIVDVLITDYSSIIFDFIPTKRPIILFTYDINDYEEQRGMYLDVKDLPGKICVSSDEIVREISNLNTFSANSDDKYAEAIKTYCYNDDGFATQRFIDIIFHDVESKDVYKIRETNKKKVILYGGSLDTNGITISLLNLLRNIDYSKYDITLIHGGNINNANKYNIESLPEPVRILYRMGTFNYTLPEYYKHHLVFNSGFKRNIIKKNIPIDLYKRELRRLVGDAKFDIGIDYSGYSPLWTLIFSSNEFNSKSIYLHSEMKTDIERRVKQNKKVNIYYNIIFNLYNNFDKVISVSKDVTDINKENLKDYVDSSKIVNVENSIDYNRVLETSNNYETYYYSDREYMLLEKNVENGFVSIKGVEEPVPDDINFITVGRLSIEKDQEKLIYAFSKVHDKYANTKLYIVGDGKLKNKLTSLIHSLKLDGKVFLVGALDNPFALLNKCDCFVMSSNYEGQGLAIIEALILGKPVISTNIPGPRGILENGFGRLVDNDEDGLIQGMVEFIEEKPTYKKFDYKSYNKQALKRFYYEVCGEKVEYDK
ncbi:glycosyltransferase [Paucisalibacillus globulus]|uniref:glycosyltransferase n=1 Tax=Paucisalibacillus globulus TaxID=351095 RepID=UPI0003FFF296|nr:glycosyltransferase [Paucisalibacillus globulus]